MATKKKRLPFAVRLRYALDAAPEAAKANLNGGSLMMAINAIEAQRNNIDPRKLGLDIDKDSTVEEIVERFCPECDGESAAKVAELLKELKGAPDTVEVTAEEGAKADEPPATDNDDEAKEAAASFAEGVKYGEKKEKEEPAQLDREHDAEGMERRAEEDKPVADEDKDAKIQGILDSFSDLDEERKKKLADALNDLAYGEAEAQDDVPDIPAKTEKEDVTVTQDSKPQTHSYKMAMDAASIRKSMRAELMADFKARSRAATQVRSVLGNIDVMAFDSADAIYGEALRKVGVNTKQYAPSAYAAMFAAYNTNRGVGKTVAQDAKPVEYGGAFANLKNINIGD